MTREEKLYDQAMTIIEDGLNGKVQDFNSFQSAADMLRTPFAMLFQKRVEDWPAEVTDKSEVTH